MPTTTLKKAGGSLVMTVPASIRDAMELSEGQRLSVAVDDGKMVLEPTPPRKRYTLDELLAQCDFEQPYSEEERICLDAPPVGRELL